MMVRMTRTDDFALALSVELEHRGRGAKSALATQLERPVSTVSGWINGTRTPDPDDTFAIERALELEPGRLSHLLGYLPLDARTVEVSEPEDAIIADGSLPGREKRLLLDMLASIRGRTS